MWASWSYLGFKIFYRPKTSATRHEKQQITNAPRHYTAKLRIWEIGFDLQWAELEILEPQLSSKPVWLNERLLYLGQIERLVEHKGKNTLGEEYLPDGTK